MRALGLDKETLLTAVARSIPPATAHQIVWAAGATRSPGKPSETRAGVCRDWDEEFMERANGVWLRAWKENQDDPRTAYEAWLRKAREGRAGANGEDGRGGALPRNPAGWTPKEPPVGTPWSERKGVGGGP